MPGQHSRLYPWFIGVAIIVAFELVVGFMFFGPACRAPGLQQAMILVALPVIYLVLMYLALKSQP